MIPSLSPRVTFACRRFLMDNRDSIRPEHAGAPGGPQTVQLSLQLPQCRRRSHKLKHLASLHLLGNLSSSSQGSVRTGWQPPP
jgi:hypothetical protein